ncbi:SNR40 protein, partial [Brachypodius atriceps]|nr:SNR40 protein [Brachypodius atriceps]
MIEQQKRKVPGPGPGPGPAPGPPPAPAAPGAAPAPGPDLPLVPVPAKRPRHDLPGAPGTGGAGGQPPAGALLQAGPPRCSSLQAPIMLLSGHEGEVYCCKFHPNGNTLASAGFDRLICECHCCPLLSPGLRPCCWGVFSSALTWLGPECELLPQGGAGSFSQLLSRSHPAGVGMSPAGHSPVSIPLTQRGMQKFTPSSLSSGCVGALQLQHSWLCLLCQVWDLRQNKLTYTMRGHADSVTGLSLSSEGSYLLSNAMDNTVRIWDVRPFAPKERCVKIFQGNVHNFEKNLLRCSWSPDGSKIAGGSADRFVYVWDTTSRRILYKLPGHAGSVNELAFHPEEPIILSASSDKRLYMGEIQ